MIHGNFKKIFIASRNPGKVKEFRKIFGQFGIFVESANDIEPREVDETGATFMENAKIKAESFLDVIDNETAILADDSGLCIDFLDGAPGIHSARYAINRNFDHAMDKVLRKLEMAKDSERKAHFVCSLYLITPDSQHHIFEGQVRGTIIREKRGKGFGFDPIFMPDGYDKTFGEITDDEKNKISHRGVAIAKFRDWVLKQ